MASDKHGRGKGTRAARTLGYYGAAAGALGILAAALTLGGCEAERDEADPLRQRTQLVTSIPQTISFKLPAGPGLGELALVATKLLKIEDRVTVMDPDGAAAAVGNSGTQATVLGVESRVGLVRSVAALEVKDRAGILGDAFSSGNIVLRSGAFVTGTQHPYSAELTPTVTESLVIELGGEPRGALNLEPPNGPGERVTNLLPGRYTTVNVKSRNRVNLVSGNYVFDHLYLEPQTRLVIDDSAGPVFLNVKVTLAYKGAIQAAGGGHPAVRMVYLGQNMAVIEQSFTGTLLAPNATLRFATTNPPPTHTGSFFAKNLEVSPDVRIVFRPYLTYEAEQEWEVDADDHGGFGLSVPTADGGTIAKTADNVVLVSAEGSTTELLAPGRRRFRVDESSGEFGYYTPSGFEAYSASGAAVGTHTMTLPGMALFAPGSTGIVLVDGMGDHKNSEWTAFRLVGTGSSPTTVATPDMEEMVSGPSELVYSTKTELVCVEHDGTERWRIPRRLLKLALSDGGTTLIGAYADDGPRIVHVDVSDGSLTAPTALDSAPYALDVSPSGEFSMAATKNRIVLYQNGVQQRVIDLPMAYYASSDLNDAGELVVGGANASGQTLVQLIGETGTGAWLEDPGPADQGAYRPHVRFRPGSADFIVVKKSGLSSYTTRKGL